MSAAAACCVVIAGCGGSSSHDAKTTQQGSAATQRLLDIKKVEAAITDSIRSQRHTKAVVSCPRPIKQAKGVDFVCKAKSKYGVTPFAVVQRDAAGHVTYAAAATSG
jgi:hypothetical protein